MIGKAVDSVVSSIVETVSPVVKQYRLNYCNACPHLFAPTRQCKLCTCFVDAKTTVKSQHCPDPDIKRW